MSYVLLILPGGAGRIKGRFPPAVISPQAEGEIISLFFIFVLCDLCASVVQHALLGFIARLASKRF
jgi:hypothetical protein